MVVVGGVSTYITTIKSFHYDAIIIYSIRTAISYNIINFTIICNNIISTISKTRVIATHICNTTIIDYRIITITTMHGLDFITATIHYYRIITIITIYTIRIDDIYRIILVASVES